MLDINLLSTMGLLVIGAPLLVLGLVSFALSGATYRLRAMRSLPAWDGMTRPFLLLGTLMVTFGATVAMPAVPVLLAQLF